MTIKDILDVINDLHIDYKISILDDFEINTYCSLNELKENQKRVTRKNCLGKWTERDM